MVYQNIFFSKTKRIYLDYAATTPVALEVLKAMMPYFNKQYGNPSSLHYFGQQAIAAIDNSREIVAKAIGLSINNSFESIIFTGSATEANNLALKGVIKNFSLKSNLRPKIIVSAIEHESILKTARELEQNNIEIEYLPVDDKGFVHFEKLEKLLDEKTVLVSVMYANNEIGTIQPIKKISEIIKNWKLENNPNSIYPLFHVDAVQAFQYLDCNVFDLGVDLMTLSAHKIYGPKGIGALYISGDKNNLKISPLIVGGHQEFDLRAGTENVPAIVGFAKAVELAVSLREKEGRRILKLANYFWQELKKIYPTAAINGVDFNEVNDKNYKLFRLPNILNIYFPNQNAEDLLIKFDLAQIAVSAGSACLARFSKPSYVLQALGLPLSRVKSSLRFSFGRFTTKKEIINVLKKVKNILK